MKNPYEGGNRTLFVCSAGILRSPTAAIVAQREFGWNCRAAGAFRSYALIPVTSNLLHWAEQIYVMEQEHLDHIAGVFKGMTNQLHATVKVLNITDEYAWMDQKLQELIVEKLRESRRDES